eukprot:3008524-Rhodomonas_salina.1
MPSIWGFSVDELAAKQRASDAQNRRAHIHNASSSGNVDRVLQLLEESDDPYVAQQLAQKAKSNLLKTKHFGAARILDETLGELPKVRFPLAESEQAPKYDVNTGQISTGKVASLLITVVKGLNLPAKDGLTGSCDPFCKITLWGPGEMGQRRRKCEKNTEVKMMTQNPEWNETFQLDVDSIDTTLEAMVYDWDEDNTHDFIGKVSLPLQAAISKLLEDREASFKQNSEISDDVRDVRAVHTYNLGKTYQSFWKTGAKSEQDTTRWLPVRAELSRLGRVVGSASAHSSSAQAEEKRMALTRMDGSADSQLGSIHLNLQLVPAKLIWGCVWEQQRIAKVSGIQLFPRKGLERINALTPSSRLVFTDEEYLENTALKDAVFAKERLLTRDVLWPKSTEGATIDSTKIFRQALAHASWRTMTEPVRGCPERKREDLLLQDAVAVVHLARSLGGGKEETAAEIRAERVVKRGENSVSDGRRAWEEGRMEDATALLEEGVALAREGKSVQLEATARKLLGDLYMLRGQFRKAREQHREHTELVSQGGGFGSGPRRPKSKGGGSRGGRRREGGEGGEGEAEAREGGDVEERLSSEEAEEECRRHKVDAREAVGLLVQRGELKHRGEGFGRGVERGALEKVLSKTPSQHRDAVLGAETECTASRGDPDDAG